MNGPQQRILQAGLGQNVVSWSRSLQSDVGPLDNPVREVLQTVFYVRRCPAEGQCPGVEASPVHAYGDGCGRGVAVALTVDQHAGEDVEGPGTVEPDVGPEHGTLGSFLLRPDSPRLLPRHLAHRACARTTVYGGRLASSPPEFLNIDDAGDVGFAVIRLPRSPIDR